MEKQASRNSEYVLHLYVCGATARSQRALMNIKAICNDHLKGSYDLQVTDIFQSPGQTNKDNIVVAPTLIKKNPLPVRRFIGDLSDTEKVISGLAIRQLD